MKISNKVRFVFSFLLLQLTVPAQQGWFQQSIGTNLYFTSCYFTDGNTGWVVGGDGPIDEAIILKTIDGGWNWASQLSSTIQALNSICFINNNKGWTVGTLGTILMTTDGGTIWTIQLSGTSSDLQSVNFTDINTGWIVGYNGTILRTTDGGINWYFQLVRIFGTMGFAYLAYTDYKNMIKFTPYVFGVAAILLNPIIKISFGRETWNVLDVMLAIIIILSTLLNLKSQKN